MGPKLTLSESKSKVLFTDLKIGIDVNISGMLSERESVAVRWPQRKHALWSGAGGKKVLKI